MSLNTLLKAAEFLELSSERSTTHTRATGQQSASVQTDRRRAVSESEALERRRRPGGAGTRETHNKLEKNRRAHLKDCFDMLKKEVPNLEEKKTSNLNILRSALKHIQILKKQEREYETQSDLLRISNQTMHERFLALKKNTQQEQKLPDNPKNTSASHASSPTKPATSCTTTVSQDRNAEMRVCPVSVATQTPPSPSKEEHSRSTASESERISGKVCSGTDSGLEGSIVSEVGGKMPFEELPNGDNDDDEKTDTDEGLSQSDDDKDIEIDVVGQDDVQVDSMEEKPKKEVHVEKNYGKAVVKNDKKESVKKGWSTTPYCSSRSRKRSLSEEKNEEDSDYDENTKEEPKAKIQACARVSC